MPQVESGRIVGTATEARGAVRGMPVFYMLASGTAAVVVLFVLIYLYFFA